MRVQLFVTSAGNDFMLDVARLVAHGLTRASIASDVLIDELPDPAPDRLAIVVAPHEFYPLFAERRAGRAAVNDLTRQAFMLNVEQPGSVWFDLACEYARRSRGVLDISTDGANECRRMGIQAWRLPLGYAPFLEGPNLADPTARPIDVLFLGHESARRNRFFARHAATFSGMRCHLAITDLDAPRREGTPGYVTGLERLQLLGAAKILLNVHSSDREYFETHRALLALANRCLLVTETSAAVAPLIAGTHFVMGALNDLPSLCRQYLDQPQEIARIASAGYTHVKSDPTIPERYKLVVAEMIRIARADGSTPADSIAHDSIIRRDAVERLARSRRERERQPDWDAEANAAYTTVTQPSVSVVITLYNYASYIGECLSSVIASEAVPGGIEIVLVDDASTDDSVERALAFTRASRIAAVLLRKRTNTGLADARNLGLRHARSKHVFILDADNWLYPNALAVLHDEIAATGAAAAYGILRRFDDETGEALGLTSCRDWSLEALLRGNYIDAMAMFERTSLLAVGGYATELIEHGWFGWEDYDLWLALGRAGARVRFVPQIVGSYRVHARSMLSRTNRHSRDLAAYLFAKFHDLVERHPGLDRYFGFPASEFMPAARPTEAHDLRSLQARCQELERRLAEMHASRSWRITRPLRFAFRLLTGRS